MDSRKIVYKVFDTPIGKIIAGATSEGCCLFEFLNRGGFKRIKDRIGKRYSMEMVKGTNRFLDNMETQVAEYFEGKRKKFSLRFDVRGTTFEMAVWRQLQNIPYGETRSYGEVARLTGRTGAARAVGRANGANYLAIIIPCHRVLEADGGLRGYGGGLCRKKFLLDFERKNSSISTN